MQITETRKEIINLISDYMDKTLSEWCLILSLKDKNVMQFMPQPDKLYKKWEIIKIWEWIDEHNNALALLSYKDVFIKIGHYDITAVLKYIDNSYRDERGMPWWDTLLELTPNDININILEELYMLPNKPLHLYTDKEDKQLLELLLKIK